MLSLFLLDGSGREFALEEGAELTVGAAASCSIRLPAFDVSRSHALLTCRHGKVIVVDLGSTNGTFVNGRRVKDAELVAGDQIRFSSVAAQVVTPSPAGAAGGAAAVLAREDSTGGSVPVPLEESLRPLLVRWAAAEHPAQLALVDWLVANRALAGAAVLDAEGEEIGVVAAGGQLADVLGDPECVALLRSGASGVVAREGVHLTVAGRDALALRAHDTPWLVLVPGRSMPDGEELALLVRLLAVARRLDSLPPAR